MNIAYHGLFVVNGPREQVHEKICQWIENSKFRLDVQANTARVSATYPGWRGFGITDKQTGSELEVLLADANGQTAVSVYHHTRRFWLFTGGMCGNILEREVDSLKGTLREEFKIA